MEIDWIVSDDTVLRPDATVVRGVAPVGHVECTPAIVVEVLSESTRNRDLELKREIYQAQRVPDYLILDPDENQLISLRLDSTGEYVSIDSSKSLQMIICGDCKFEIATSSLFK